jgi:transcriptional regulator
MYIPDSFAERDVSKLHDFVIANSFATLVSAGSSHPDIGGEPLASHLPLLCERHTGPLGRIVGHMAAANPHWRNLDGEKVLAIFTGPHCYISPTLDKTANSVPTWNYVAVHVVGTVHIERDPVRLREIVQAYVEFYEASMPEPWSLDTADSDFIARLLGAIVGFTIEIERIEGKWKLSQNHSPERRESVILGLQSLGGTERMRTASLMAETIEK